MNIKLILERFHGKNAILVIQGSDMNGRFLSLPPKIFIEMIKNSMETHRGTVILESNEYIVNLYRKWLR